MTVRPSLPAYNNNIADSEGLMTIEFIKFFDDLSRPLNSIAPAVDAADMVVKFNLLLADLKEKGKML